MKEKVIEHAKRRYIDRTNRSKRSLAVQMIIDLQKGVRSMCEHCEASLQPGKKGRIYPSVGKKTEGSWGMVSWG